MSSGSQFGFRALYRVVRIQITGRQNAQSVSARFSGLQPSTSKQHIIFAYALRIVRVVAKLQITASSSNRVWHVLLHILATIVHSALSVRTESRSNTSVYGSVGTKHATKGAEYKSKSRSMVFSSCDIRACGMAPSNVVEDRLIRRRLEDMSIQISTTH
ncbi:hypothetical protein CC86DRAFT_97487 [Ophiobolus disseminans]|uniref:Uncharacterized protein n=1 Tax=Ophiobolus disseminans TaxID=1469910 RepID=A0A6A6ZPK8_9PLEO|nr:hypothetical protein CC86DRAFT_97487 [Ophiobolus disseminans]